MMRSLVIIQSSTNANNNEPIKIITKKQAIEIATSTRIEICQNNGRIKIRNDSFFFILIWFGDHVVKLYQCIILLLKI